MENRQSPSECHGRPATSPGACQTGVSKNIFKSPPSRPNASQQLALTRTRGVGGARSIVQPGGQGLGVELPAAAGVAPAPAVGARHGASLGGVEPSVPGPEVGEHTTSTRWGGVERASQGDWTFEQHSAKWPRNHNHRHALCWRGMPAATSPHARPGGLEQVGVRRVLLTPLLRLQAGWAGRSGASRVFMEELEAVCQERYEAE